MQIDGRHALPKNYEPKRHTTPETKEQLPEYVGVVEGYGKIRVDDKTHLDFWLNIQLTPEELALLTTREVDVVGVVDTGKEREFLNSYLCHHCHHQWHEVWTATCDSTCPKCGARNVSPTQSDDVK
jgi:hypothetical protein